MKTLHTSYNEIKCLGKLFKKILLTYMTKNIELIFRENKWLDHVLHSEDRPFFCSKSYISSKCSHQKSGFNQPTAEQEQPTRTNWINQQDLNSYKLTI